MADHQVDEFLDLYKQLEQLLKAKYGSDLGRYESPVLRFENSRECGEMKEELGAIREIRNLLQHNPKVSGSYIIEPSAEIMDALRKIVRMAEHPKLAIDFGVKASSVYHASLSSPLMKVLHVMKERGFSHVPILEKGKVYGVLSAYAVFEFVTEQGMQILTEATRVSAMKEYLPIAKHKQEYFIFLPKDTTFTEADDAFEKRDSKGRRLVVIFITETGSPNEPVLAMLTPWSVVGK